MDLILIYGYTNEDYKISLRNRNVGWGYKDEN